MHRRLGERLAACTREDGTRAVRRR